MISLRNFFADNQKFSDHEAKYFFVYARVQHRPTKIFYCRVLFVYHKCVQNSVRSGKKQEKDCLQILRAVCITFSGSAGKNARKQR